jgi:putative pyruvate formate lyase activating enzyme
MSEYLSPEEIHSRAQKAYDLSTPCRLCPRTCGVDRPSGELGFCGAGALPAVAALVPHFGEEPPLTGSGGAGAIFFSRCNMACIYCQNHQISQGPIATAIDHDTLAVHMLRLQERGCSNIEAVSSSHHLPGFLTALSIARRMGLHLPIVYNSNGFESGEALDLLNGVVDIYLPDIKYASDDMASRYSAVDDYVDHARKAVLKMHEQVGNLVLDMNGTAVKGLIVRLLVLPGDVSGTFQTLLWIKDSLPATITISLMSQYSPLHKANQYSPLNRRITRSEYDEMVDMAWGLGFENVFVQYFSSQDIGIPDFFY